MGNERQSIRIKYNLVLAATLLMPFKVQAAVPDSLRALEVAVKQSPKDRAAWVRLGYAYLDAGDLEQAKKAFRKGTRGPTKAAAYNGLGMAYMRDPKGLKQKAFQYFQRALGADPNYIEAQMNIARLHIELKDADSEGALKKAIRMDSTYAPAYLMLAEWYFDSGYEDRMIPLYKRYVALRPDDLEGFYGLIRTYVEQYRFGLSLEAAELVLAEYPEEARFLPLAGQAHAARGDPDRALRLFQQYFEMIPEPERALYEDLSLVSFSEELDAYQATSMEERETFLEGFWRKRDLMLVSGGEARRVEHYRRVWYARTYFAEKVHPWDRRGEIYIRYGEPDYRSRSDRINPFPNSAVELVKERIAYVIYGGESAEEMTLRPMTGPVYPIPRTPAGPKMPWESWVYTTVGRGTEFVFVDEFMAGRWDFPPMSEGTNIRMMDAHPDVVLQDLVSEMPEYHDVPPGVEPLEFYYDLATFRGEPGETKVEVYFGIPPEQVTGEASEGQTWFRVRRTTVLADRMGEEVHRKKGGLVFAVAKAPQPERGTFVADVASLKVPPGDYRLAVQITDQISGKWGIYMQEVEVPAYTDSLGISDLELAWKVSKTRKEEKFRKGEVWVIPMPSRSYRKDQNVSVYYEVYHLQKDTFGQTHYRVAYTIRRDIRWRKSLIGALVSGFRKLLEGGEPEVVVSYEGKGTDSWEPIYFELETEKIKPGLNEIEVTLSDLNSGGTVSKKAVFYLDRD